MISFYWLPRTNSRIGKYQFRYICNFLIIFKRTLDTLSIQTVHFLVNYSLKIMDEFSLKRILWYRETTYVDVTGKRWGRRRFQVLHLHHTIKLIRTHCAAHSFFENSHDFI